MQVHKRGVAVSDKESADTSDSSAVGSGEAHGTSDAGLRHATIARTPKSRVSRSGPACSELVYFFELGSYLNETFTFAR